MFSINQTTKTTYVIWNEIIFSLNLTKGSFKIAKGECLYVYFIFFSLQVNDSIALKNYKKKIKHPPLDILETKNFCWKKFLEIKWTSCIAISLNFQFYCEACIFYLRNRYIAENKVSKKLYILVVLSVNALTERKESAG